MSLINTYTYEEGTDGSSIPVGSNGVIGEGAAVSYNAANAIHGTLCAKMAASASSLVYNLPASGSNSWSDSFYFKIGANTATVSVVANIRNSGTQIAKLSLDPSTSKFRISNSASVVQATSTATWTTGQVIRSDLHYSYDGANISVTWDLFIGANSEGTTPDDTLTATFAVAGVPNRFALGSITASWTIYYDTYRQYDSSSDTIAPYDPGVPAVQIYDGSSLSAAAVYVAVPTQTPNLSVDFEDGTTGAFTTVQGATVGSSYAYTGTNGCQLAPASGTNYATLTYNAAPAGHAWGRFKANFRIVTITNPSNTYTNVFEIGNSLVVAPKNQFTVYVNGTDLFMDFRTTLDETMLDNNIAVGVWHSIDARVNFGVNPYIAHITYDGVALPDLVSSVVCTPATVSSLWMGYPSNATDQTIDWDNVEFYVGDSDPGLVSLVAATAAVA
jgi:hypothetical protein